jgi:hypothetical protein
MHEMGNFKTGENIQLLFRNLYCCKQTNNQTNKRANKQGAKTIKTQAQNKNNENNKCDKRQLVFYTNTRYYISHKECRTQTFVKWREREIFI